ncbi:PilC/PilY family type IV pilus protein [Acidovorax sp.]|jgi:type IV pilus assembly protein PilY1|uniref:pilus assembly protein n=1 Tax=Acidovorax sp. TaxID=1872122 RepID=UPI0025BA2B04|nr:PilC/PilY family type IV pilus protein [Acidovorax sp.]
MPHHTHHRAHFQKTLIALAACAALAPHSGWALDFAQSPPGTVEPYVAPNVIISVDDSGSMDFCLNKESASNCIGSTDANNSTTPNADGTWPVNSRRMNVLKYALKQVFNDTSLLPDGKIRLAWQVLHNNGNASGAGNVNSGSMNTNSMRPVAGSHRTNFISFVNSLDPGSGTPTHKMFKQADDYMRRSLGSNSPWASKPGEANPTYLGCRRNYHIVMTDGRWNGYDSDYAAGGNKDGVNSMTLPDNTKYGSATSTGTAAFSKIYRDGTDNTLADWAFKSWSEALQDPTGLTGSVTPIAEYDRAPATETIGGVALPKYWNPKYNPANWPHMVTYSIGFSAMAYQWKMNWTGSDTKYNITRPTEMVPFSYDGDFPNLVNGTKTWPDMGNEDRRSLDLWHSALNGRGRFFAVEQGKDLEKAFRLIIQQINAQTEPDRGSTATSGSNVSRNDVGKYVANYVPKDAWKGYVEAETVKPDGTTVPAAGWAGKNTANLLDDTALSVGNRLILSYSNKVVDTTTGEEKKGVPFKWAADESNLSTAQKDFLNLKSDGSSDSLGEDRLNFIRGDRTKEGKESPPDYPATKPFRERKSRQGSIVNSEVWYVGAPVSNYALKGYTAFARTQKTRLPMIYVGGNDGMLHGFSAVNGVEKLAYVPRGVIPAVGRLADPNFNNNHLYSVDGSPMSGDVDLGTGDTADSGYTPDWRTLLVGTLGAGGKGYFVLDVTKPGTTAGDAGNFSETNAQQLVVMDKTRHATEAVATVVDCEDTAVTPEASKEACLAAADMGHIFAKPVMDDANPQRTTQIVRLNNNRWAAVMGNGYNSKSQRPVLLVQYLDGDKKLLRLVATGTTATGATNTTDNGLSAPRLVDINSDGRPDVVYAGDVQGNLWKFLLTDSDDTKWGVAQWDSNADQTTNHTTTGTPLFSAKGGTEGSPDSRTLAQPITAAPSVRANDRKKDIDPDANKTEMVAVGGMMVAVGTGRNVTKDDPQSNNKQTLYSVLDNTRYRLEGTKKDRVKVCASKTDGDCSKLVKSNDDTPKTVALTALVQRTIPDTPLHTRDGKSFWTVDATTQMNWATHKGWYMDLPKTRERVLKPMGFYDGSNLLTVLSQVPAKGSRLDPNVESCEAGSVDDERQYLTLINIMDGKKPSVQIIDTNGDGAYNMTSDKGGSSTDVPSGPITMIKKGDKMIVSGTKKDGSKYEESLALMPEESMRPSWRQLR